MILSVPLPWAFLYRFCIRKDASKTFGGNAPFFSVSKYQQTGLFKIGEIKAEGCNSYFRF
jgi:hypothetical protein